jgi:lipoate-protein ligase A
MPDIIDAATLADVAMVAESGIAAPMTCFAYFETADLGLRRQEQIADEITSDDQRLLLVWQAPRALIVGSSDTRLPDFSSAANHLREQGWPVIVRRSGGSACPISKGTLQIALARVAVPGITIDAAYIELTDLIRGIFDLYGLKLEMGTRTSAFCPGRYDLSIAGRKIAGLSQHWRQRKRRTIVTTAATLIIDEDVQTLVSVVNLFYHLGGTKKQCSASAVGNMRQHLTKDGSMEDAFRKKLCRQIGREANKVGISFAVKTAVYPILTSSVT